MGGGLFRTRPGRIPLEFEAVRGNRTRQGIQRMQRVSAAGPMAGAPLARDLLFRRHAPLWRIQAAEGRLMKGVIPAAVLM